MPAARCVVDPSGDRSLGKGHAGKASARQIQRRERLPVSSAAPKPVVMACFARRALRSLFLCVLPDVLNEVPNTPKPNALFIRVRNLQRRRDDDLQVRLLHF